MAGPVPRQWPVRLEEPGGRGHDEELARLKVLVGDLTMRLELSREAVQRLREEASGLVDHCRIPLSDQPRNRFVCET